MRELEKVPIKQVVDNPFQTRADYDSESIAELAKSIKDRGLLQVPIGRRVNGQVELAFGHRRLRALKKLRRKDVPIEIGDFSDEEMFQIAFAENNEREDITAVEEARAIQRSMEQFGWTQKEVGQKLGLSRPTISNKLALLKHLPAEIQDEVGAGKISERKAQAIVGLYKFPPEHIAIHDEKGWGRTHQEYVKLALLPETSSDAIREFRSRMQSEIDQGIMRRKEKKKRAGALEQWKKENPDQELLNLDELDYRSFEIVQHKRPRGCSDKCECADRGMRMHWNGEDVDVVSICTNPDRLRALKTKQTKAANKAKRTKAENLKKRFVKAFEQIGLTNDAMAQVFMVALRDIPAACIREAVKLLELDEEKYKGLSEPTAYFDMKHYDAVLELDDATRHSILFLAFGLGQIKRSTDLYYSDPDSVKKLKAYMKDAAVAQPGTLMEKVEDGELDQD